MDTTKVSEKAFVVMQKMECKRCMAYDAEESECRLLPPIAIWSDIQESIFFASPVVPEDHYCMQFTERPNG